jgi:hypothetical protein
VLVTNTAYALEAIGQLYLDRADCENGFDDWEAVLYFHLAGCGR